MVKMAVDMLKQGMIDEKTALLRQEPAKLDELLHPVFNKEALKKLTLLPKVCRLLRVLPAGVSYSSPTKPEEWKNRGEKVVLVRQETSPEDLRGMNVSEGILTARGGMTSHAAVVAVVWVNVVYPAQEIS